MCVGLASAVRQNGQLGDLAAEILPELTPGTHFYLEESELFQEKMVEGRACYCKQAWMSYNVPAFFLGVAVPNFETQ